MDLSLIVCILAVIYAVFLVFILKNRLLQASAIFFSLLFIYTIIIQYTYLLICFSNIFLGDILLIIASLPIIYCTIKTHPIPRIDKLFIISLCLLVSCGECFVDYSFIFRYWPINMFLVGRIFEIIALGLYLAFIFRALRTKANIDYVIILLLYFIYLGYIFISWNKIHTRIDDIIM